MNDRRIPCAADENAILITAEFYEDGDLLKTGLDRVHRYDLDLIVPDDITLDQLLAAVKNGIRKKLIEDYQVDPEHMTENDAYSEMMRRYEEMLRKAQESYKTRVRERRGVRKRLHKQEKSRSNGQDETEGLSREQQLYWKWLICWKVYHTCRELYDRGYPERPATKLRKCFHLKDYPPHPVIACGNISLKNWENGAFLSLASSNQIWLERERHGEKTLRELGFLSSARLIFDPITCHEGGALLNEREIPCPVGEQFPVHRIGWREGPSERDKEIHLKASDDVASFRKMRLVAAALAGGLGIALLLCGWWAIDLLPVDVQMAGMLRAAAGICSVGLSLLLYRKLFNKDRYRWRSGYEKYIREIIGHIVYQQAEDTRELEELYPPVYDPAEHQDLIKQINHIGHIIYSRRREHSDFLKVRIGTTTEESRLVPSGLRFTKPAPQQVFSPLRYKNIGGTRHRDFRVLLPGEAITQHGLSDGTSGYLDELPGDLEQRYSFLKHVPVLMDLKNTRSVGVLYQNKAQSFLPLLSTMILDLCCSHVPEDLQMVLFCPGIRGIEQQELFVRQFRQLPHFQRLLQDISPFVFDQDHGRLVLDRLHRISQERRRQGADCGSHVVVFVLEDHGLTSHPLAELMPQGADELDGNPYGFTFIHFGYFPFQLPPYCSHILERSEQDKWFYIPGQPRREQAGSHSDAEFAVEPDAFYPVERSARCGDCTDRMYRSFKILSALYHLHLSRGQLPRFYSVLRMLEEYAAEQGARRKLLPVRTGDKLGYYARLTARLRRYLKAQWAQTEAFRFPIGKGTDRVAQLELDDPAFGPSVLITGGSDAERSRSLTTILLSMALHNSPETVKLLLVDPVGNGIDSRLRGLPHVARTVGLSGTQTLEQRLDALLSELKQMRQRRIREFAHMGVDDIRAYNRAVRDLENQKAVLNQTTMKPMSRVVLAADHVVLLSRLLHADGAALDLTAELLDLMDGAERYGIHVILSTEADDRLLVPELLARFRTRVCLKLDDPADSERILGSAEAASVQMPGNGRAYLHQTEQGGIRPVQIADCDRLLRVFYEMPFQITYMNPYGRYELFYDSEGSAEPETEKTSETKGNWRQDSGAAQQESGEAADPGTKPKRPVDTVYGKKAQRPHDTVDPRFSRGHAADHVASDKQSEDVPKDRQKDDAQTIRDQSVLVREYLVRLIERLWKELMG